MFALYRGELIKVIKLAKKKLTNKGFIYEFDIEGGNGKLIEKCEKETKQVNYFGIELTVDADINFLATDDYGFVYGYIFKPRYSRVTKVWASKGVYVPGPVAKVDLGDKDWKKTRVEV
ncbi:MAG: hypothetical protein ACL7AX_02530 [Candidatus Arsenophonus phytopathogenicus]